MCIQSQSAAAKMDAIMLLVYGDESFDAGKERVCAVVGVVGTPELWVELENKWKARNGTIPFHAVDCWWGRGDYENIPREQSQALYIDLVNMLADSGLGGFASVLDLAAQRATFAPPTFNPPVYYQSFMTVLEKMRNAAENRNDFAELTFDSRLESNHNAGLIYAYLRESNPQWKERLASKISFECSHDNPRIQVADLFAYEAMKDLDNQIGPQKRPTRKSWEVLTATNHFRSEKVSEEHFGDPRMEPKSVMLALGFTPEDYASWLDKHNRQNCHTAYFEFLIWHRGRMTPEQLANFDAHFGGDNL
ncbi:hypothetical protein SBA5_120005 [Candidatus Sulfotelmatomonas gaucii]|uniref:DUF3800 domain-containing protein n=1 Tax=Candidatus Sulfuritelmatomonas gaucii TaxID=2043161 RepID=A0A2N9L3X6_9BACT|nr:hypothetical protein SBA5_120005 [Candidatus Sulfotelmatomonas gaucii]